MTSRARVCALFALATWSLGCGTVSSFDRAKGFGGARLVGKLEEVPVRGYPIKVDVAAATYQGELLGLDAEGRMYIEVPNGAVIAIGAKGPRVHIDLRPSHSTEYGVWGVLGTLSTASHGYFLVISAPIWILVSIPVAVSAADKTTLEAPAESVPLEQFARWPQGVPASVRVRARAVP